MRNLKYQTMVRITNQEPLCFQGSSSSSSGKVPDCEAPVLLALTSSGHLLAYQAFSPTSSQSSSTQVRSGPKIPQRSDLAWRRLQHLDWMTHRDPALVPGLLPHPGIPPPLLPRMSRFNCLASTNPLTAVTGCDFFHFYVPKKLFHAPSYQDTLEFDRLRMHQSIDDFDKISEALDQLVTVHTHACLTRSLCQ